MRSTDEAALRDRFDGLDLLRILSCFGVVFLHVDVTAGSPASLNWLVKMRDFSLPVMVLTSFFLLAASQVRRPKRDFGRFVVRRAERLLMPMVFWTAVYSVALVYVLPALFGFESEGFPPLTVFLTGYRHLWYLQFLFVGSVLAFPFVSYLVRKMSGHDRPAAKLWAVGALGASGVLAISGCSNDWVAADAATDVSVRLFITQSSRCAPLIPIAVFLGSVWGGASGRFDKPRSRRLYLVAAAGLGVMHVATDLPFTSEAFALAVFLAALQPLSRALPENLAAAAGCSYAIYILHFLPVQILWGLVALKGFTFGGGAVVGMTVAVYIACLLAALAARRVEAFSWLLPHKPQLEPAVLRADLVQDAGATA
jgi:peptidoglycan/LPS O-acetylase OafA/YrhL